MVASVDGKAAIGGKASSIGSKIDRLAMRNLRAQVDAVVIGASTLRAERLSLGLDTTSRGPQPLGIILTTTGDVPLHTNLVQHAGQDILVISTETIADALTQRLADRAQVLRIPAGPDGYPDLTQALRTLKREYGVGSLLVEGGPRLNRALIFEDLLDELFVTIAPKLLGGDPPDIRTILEGTIPAPTTLRLLSVHLAADELFLRYALSGATTQ